MCPLMVKIYAQSEHSRQPTQRLRVRKGRQDQIAVGEPVAVAVDKNSRQMREERPVCRQGDRFDARRAVRCAHDDGRSIGRVSALAWISVRADRACPSP